MSIFIIVNIHKILTMKRFSCMKVRKHRHFMKSHHWHTCLMVTITHQELSVTVKLI